MKEDIEFWKKDISRRVFMKWSGVAGGAAVAGGSFVRYTPQAFAQEAAAAESKLPFGADTVVPVKCGCGDVCGAYHVGNAYVKDGVIVYYDGNEEAENKGGLCPRGISAMQIIYHPDRVKYPMKRLNAKGEEGRFQRISWEEAYDLVAGKIVEAIQEEGPHTVNFPGGHSMTRTIGSARSRLTSMFGFDGMGVQGLCWDNLMFGPMVTLGDYYHAHVEDFHHAKLIIIWGHNKALAMPSEWAEAFQVAKEKYGAKLVVVDPRFTETAEKADLYLPVRPGTDAALALGIANVLITEDLYDKEFVAKYTVGFDEFKELALQYTPEKVEEITWCPADRIRTLARWYGTIEPAILEHGRGGNFTSGNSGWLCSRATTCLIGLTGQVGVRGSGFSVENSSFSPSNTGFSSFPVASLSWKGDPLVTREVKAPAGAWGAVGVWYDGDPYRHRVVYAVTEQIAKNPDQTALEESVKKIPFFVVEQRFINWTASRFADVVLPNALWTEQAMFYGEYTHIVCTGPAVPPMFESKPSYLIFAELADKICEKLGLNLTKEEIFPWRTDEDIINALFTREDMPLGGYPALNYQDAIQHPEGYRMTRYYNQEGFIPYHVDNDPSKDLYFPTPSGKIEFVADRLAEFDLPTLPIHEEPTESPISTPDVFEEYPLINNARVHRHWGFLHYNLVADGGYASPLIREAFETAKEPCVELNPNTAKAMGLAAGDMVWVESRVGKLQGRLLLSERVHPQMVNTPFHWANCENRINPREPSLFPGIQLPLVGPYGEGGTSRHMGGQATFAGVLCKVYKA